MQLIAITPEQTIPDETKTVRNLFANGLRRLHIRKSLSTRSDVKDYLCTIDKRYHPFITIHQHFELLNEFELGGIHLNSAIRNDRRVAAQINLLSPKTLSSSFHSWQEIIENEFPYNYVFISPVFDSISKAGYKAGISLHGAREAKQTLAAQSKYCPAVIGLGGVGAGQLNTLHQYGFDGAAMLGAIWQSADPVAAFEEAMQIINSLERW